MWHNGKKEEKLEEKLRVWCDRLTQRFIQKRGSGWRNRTPIFLDKSFADHMPFIFVFCGNDIAHREKLWPLVAIINIMISLCLCLRPVGLFLDCQVFFCTNGPRSFCFFFTNCSIMPVELHFDAVSLTMTCKLICFLTFPSIFLYQKPASLPVYWWWLT